MSLPREDSPRRRRADAWHARVGAFWDWVDKRDIDTRLISLVVLWGTVEVTRWAMGYAAEHSEKAGTDIGLIIAAVTAPYCFLQGAALRFFFESRK